MLRNLLLAYQRGRLNASSDAKEDPRHQRSIIHRWNILQSKLYETLCYFEDDSSLRYKRTSGGSSYSHIGSLAKDIRTALALYTSVYSEATDRIISEWLRIGAQLDFIVTNRTDLFWTVRGICKGVYQDSYTEDWGLLQDQLEDTVPYAPD